MKFDFLFSGFLLSQNEEPVFLTETYTTTTTEPMPTLASTTPHPYVFTTQNDEEFNTVVDYTVAATTRSNLFVSSMFIAFTHTRNR